MKKAIRKAVRGKEAQEIYTLLVSNDLQGALSLLLKMEEEASFKRKKEIEDLIKYLLSNSSGLLNYREKLPQELKGNLRALGAAEGNIDRILANRFKKRGMSWSKRGANSLAKVIAMRENGDLGKWPPFRKTLGTCFERYFQSEKHLGFELEWRGSGKRCPYQKWTVTKPFFETAYLSILR